MKLVYILAAVGGTAITEDGGISAEWVLVGVIGLFCMLLWNNLKTMQSEIKKLQEDNSENRTEIAVLKSERSIASEIAKELIKEIKNNENEDRN